MSTEFIAKKKIINADILENTCIATGIYRMVIGGMEISRWFGEAIAGQFVNIYTDNAARLLPRPISLCRLEPDRFTVIYKAIGKGTQEMAGKKPGDKVRISTPLGNGYSESIDFAKNIMIAAGGVGVPPMLELAIRLRKRGCRITAILGFANESFLVEDFREVCDEVFVSTENGSEGFEGNALQLIKERGIVAEQCFACGPKAMLRSLNEYCGEQNIELLVSLEERMGCGYGACVGCSVTLLRKAEPASPDSEIYEIKKKVCKDGPVFYGKEVAWDDL